MLSADTTSGGGGRLRGQARWNLDASLARKFTFSERYSATVTAQVFNVFNHVWFSDPSLSGLPPSFETRPKLDTFSKRRVSWRKN
jgi:hypothetical protein